MVLPLVTSVGPDFIKNWPGQNIVNSNLIDAYAGPCLPTQALQTYTPILTATSTPVSLGSTGTISGVYYRIFDQIYTWGYFIFGTGFAKGSGEYRVTLPFKAKTLTPPTNISGNAPILGNAQVWDNSTSAGRLPATVTLETAELIRFDLTMESGFGTRVVKGEDIPIIWAVGDGVRWFARYQRDPT